VILFSIIASVCIGIIFLYFDIYEVWDRCNILGKISIILAGILGICGICLIFMLVVMFICMCYLADLKKFFIKKEL
jgi:hypothetical protein